jgi:hypothetical protein
MSIHAFVSLKQPDLHAISALASLQGLLGDSAPTHLFRCRHLTFDQPENAAFSEASFAPLLASRFDVVNPNKERLGWSLPPEVTLPDGHVLFWVDVVSRQPNPPETLYFSDQIVALSVSVTWGIVIPAQGMGMAALQTLVSDRLLVGRSLASGLLVNPVLETAQFL